MKHYDIVIIGGGPAGLTAAALIASAGLKIIVIEKEKIALRPRSWIVWQDEIVKLGFKDAIINKIDNLVFSSFLGAKYNYNHTASAILDTKKVLFAMKDEAIKNSAIIAEQEEFIKIKQSKNRIYIKTDKEVYCAYYCIDATGALSLLQKKLSGGLQKSGHMGCYAVEINGLKIKDTSTAQIFDASFPGKDYFWMLPYGKNSALIGCFFFEELNSKTTKRAKNSLKKYMKYKNFYGRTTAIIKGNIPIMEQKHIRKKRLFFCGDSASSPLPSSGYGLLSAISEAKILAVDIIKNFKSGNFDYEKKIIDSRYPGYELHYLASDILKNINDELLNKAIAGMNNENPGFIANFLKGDDLSIAFVLQAVKAIYHTFSAKELTELAIKKNYKEFIEHVIRVYPGATPGVIKKIVKQVIELARGL